MDQPTNWGQVELRGRFELASDDLPPFADFEGFIGRLASAGTHYHLYLKEEAAESFRRAVIKQHGKLVIVRGLLVPDQSAARPYLKDSVLITSLKPAKG